MWIADRWKDYSVLDTSEGEKLERWGRYILLRPDPQVIWSTTKTIPEWLEVREKEPEKWSKLSDELKEAVIICEQLLKEGAVS